MNTLQADGPLADHRLMPTNQPFIQLVRQWKRGQIIINPPYQRGDVWNTRQRVMLMRSALSGLPIASIVLNQRKAGTWAMVDGKQRLTTLRMWFDGELAVPASWFDPADVIDSFELATAHDRPADFTDTGRYVTWNRLSEELRGGLEMTTLSVPVATAHVKSVQAEAEIYLSINGGGTPQTDADLDNARRVRSGSGRIVEVADDDVFGKAYLAGYDDEAAGRADPQREEYDDAYSAGANAADQDRHDQTPGKRRDPDRDIP